MSFLRKFSRSLALLAVVSLVVWSVGCADSAGGPPKAKAGAKSGAAKSPEAGSSTGGGTTVPGKK